jgi:hypothetical protein
MKKNIIFICLTFVICASSYAQEGISIREITVNYNEKGISDGSFTVTFRDNNVRYLSDDHPNNFTWYLSYKGKRVSDYYYSTARSMSSFKVKAVAWPDEVPKGNEKYVTAQLGKEPVRKDRRDDD